MKTKVMRIDLTVTSTEGLDQEIETICETMGGAGLSLAALTTVQNSLILAFQEVPDQKTGD